MLGDQGYDVTQLIAEADEDGNGAINLQEFCNHMRKRYGMPFSAPKRRGTVAKMFLV